MALSLSRAAKLRSANFRNAIASSLASKITTVALQIIAMPIAAISLGSHGFALYAMLTAAVGWLSLSNLGIGPTLIVRLAAAHIHGDLDTERSIFSSAFFPAFVISAVVSLTGLLVIWMFPIHNIFGPLYITDEYTIRWGLTALVSMFFMQTNLSLFESAQAGYQEQYIQNIISAVSSVPCILAVLILAKRSPTPVDLILALHVPVVLFRCGNAALIIWRHPHIFPSITAFRWTLSKKLVKSGSIFSLAGGLGNFLAHILPVILVGRAFSSDVAAAFAATMNAIILASGVISMLSTPLWPAIADSVARGDRDWAQRAYRRLLWSVMIFGLLTAFFLAARGDWLFHVWFKGQINPSQSLILAAALYFLASCWEVAHFTILVGLHKIAVASLLVFIRALLGIIVILVFLKMGNEANTFIIMFIAIVVIDFIPLRILVLRELSPRS
jgi:O-antigen/teichoic acid export membrane protein